MNQESEDEKEQYRKPQIEQSKSQQEIELQENQRKLLLIGEQQENQKAIEIQYFVQYDYNDFDLNQRNGKELIKIGSFQQAFDIFSDLIKKNPKNLEVQKLKAITLKAKIQVFSRFYYRNRHLNQYILPDLENKQHDLSINIVHKSSIQTHIKKMETSLSAKVTKLKWICRKMPLFIQKSLWKIFINSIFLYADRVGKVSTFKTQNLEGSHNKFEKKVFQEINRILHVYSF